MRAQVITCDECAAVLVGTEASNNNAGGVSLTVYNMQNGENRSFDICPTCTPKVLAPQFREHVTVAEVQTASAPKAPKASKPK